MDISGLTSDLLAGVISYVWSIGSGGFSHVARCPHVACNRNQIVCQTVSQTQRATPPPPGATLPSSSAQSQSQGLETGRAGNLVPVSGPRERLANPIPFLGGGREPLTPLICVWLQVILELLLTFKELFYLQNREFFFSPFTSSV